MDGILPRGLPLDNVLDTFCWSSRLHMFVVTVDDGVLNKMKASHSIYFILNLKDLLSHETM